MFFKNIFLGILILLVVFFGVAVGFYYYRGRIPVINIQRATQNSIGVDPNSPLSVDYESGYFYGRGVVLGNNNGLVTVEFMDNQRKEIVFYGGENTILYDGGREYYGTDKIEKWREIRVGDSVVVVFSPEMIATYVKIN